MVQKCVYNLRNSLCYIYYNLCIFLYLLQETWENAQIRVCSAEDEEQQEEKKERNLQKAVIDIKNKYGKNAIIKGMNLQDAGTTIDRNNQVGGHKA